MSTQYADKKLRIAVEQENQGSIYWFKDGNWLDINYFVLTGDWKPIEPENVSLLREIIDQNVLNQLSEIAISMITWRNRLHRQQSIQE